jgi:hypothetical protein
MAGREWMGGRLTERYVRRSARQRGIAAGSRVMLRRRRAQFLSDLPQSIPKSLRFSLLDYCCFPVDGRR